MSAYAWNLGVSFLVTAIDPERSFTLWARPTALQQKALDLLGFTRTQ